MTASTEVLRAAEQDQAIGVRMVCGCRPKIWRVRRGMTLVELVIVVAIVGVLAAMAIPSFAIYIKDARLSEAVTNLQAILASEEAYFARYGRYTDNLGWCPRPMPPPNETQLWPGDVAVACDGNPAGSGRGWAMLGWAPDSAVFFRYRVFSHNDDGAMNLTRAPAVVLAADPFPGPDGTILATADNWAVNWDNEGFTPAPPPAPSIPPWCTIEAQADTDDDGEFVFVRTNSYNNKHFKRENVW